MSTPVVELNFVNKSYDKNDSEILLFQKNTASGANEVIAWKVIKNCKPGDHHAFKYSFDLAISVGDAYDDYSPRLPVAPGDAFRMTHTDSGNELVVDDASKDKKAIEVTNDLPAGPIRVNIYRGDKLVAVKTGLPREQTASFIIPPGFYIGVVSMCDEGIILNPQMITSISTQFSVEGIMKADIVMTGGGAGQSSKPFAFALENVIFI